MEMTLKKKDYITKCIKMASDILKIPFEHMWVDYDKEADVLYLSFRKPQRATKTIETDDGILIRKDSNKIVGITIMDASCR